MSEGFRVLAAPDPDPADQAAPPRPDMAKPAGIPEDFGDHMRLLCDLLALSFQMDLTRIGTFMVTWQDRPFWWVGPSGKDRVLFWVPWTGYAMPSQR